MKKIKQEGKVRGCQEHYYRSCDLKGPVFDGNILTRGQEELLCKAPKEKTFGVEWTSGAKALSSGRSGMVTA